MLSQEVHVWVASLDLPAAVLERLALTLAPDEHERAARFHFDADRRRFVAGRAIARQILGREYLGYDPAGLVFALGPMGKPSLGGPHARDGLELNLAHSGDLALIAVAEGRLVGVDVERLRPLPDLDGLARLVLTPWEQVELDRVAPAERAQAFFQVWTRKEAFLKATGEGLTRAPATFEVSVAPDASPVLRAVDDDPARAEVWALMDVEAPLGYVGALVVGRPAPTPRVLYWSASDNGRRDFETES